MFALERGRVAQRLRDRDKATAAFQLVAGAWQHADPELQQVMAEARAPRARSAARPVAFNNTYRER